MASFPVQLEKNRFRNISVDGHIVDNIRAVLAIIVLQTFITKPDSPMFQVWGENIVYSFYT